MKPADKVYKLLFSQYAPVIEHLRAHITKKQFADFQELPTIRKVYILDRWHAQYMEGNV